MSIRLTERDLQIINFIDKYGDTSSKVLSEIFFTNVRSMQRRLTGLVEENILTRNQGGRMFSKPQTGENYVYSLPNKLGVKHYEYDYLYTNLVPYMNRHDYIIKDWKRRIQVCEKPKTQFSLYMSYLKNQDEYATFVEYCLTVTEFEKVYANFYNYLNNNKIEYDFPNSNSLIILTQNSELQRYINNMSLENIVILTLNNLSE